MIYQGSSIVFPTSGRMFKYLISLFTLGISLFLSVCLVGLVGLGLATWLVLQLIFRLFLEVTAYANHSDVLTQVLLILVIGFVLQKVYGFLGRSVRSFRLQ